MVDDVSPLAQDGRDPAVAIPTLVVMIDGLDRLLDLRILILKLRLGKVVVERASLEFDAF